ncbi:hypothetical protein [Metabacillus bambusae]|uniref:Uncharacterized protein n=1 Tax=Metabacillus bambusae TaxID=2795218 RepID=A0ABS3N3J4_9BACI|nr:hypothetical protein [Metabacillus bambusae]MBO1512886.1 hypothetical protein [Metabacillus bambusae]
MTNIIDGMDQARFRSNGSNQNKGQNRDKTEEKKMPLVLKNLKNGS